MKRPARQERGTIRMTSKSGKVITNSIGAGAVMALLAVAGSFVVGTRASEAYGVCMACHGRDLLHWLINLQLGAQLTVAPAFLVFPALTTVGALLGAALGALTSGEFRWRVPENPITTFIYGVLVMNFALLAAGCATRLLLRAATLEPLALSGATAMVAGAAAATWWLRWRALR
ncbi:MAG: YeeE/YedE thiosulfate transporter family protein [Halopseudomonas sp.]